MQNSPSTVQPTMSDLVQKVGTLQDVQPGDKVSGTIIHISKGEVVLDIPCIGLGLVRGRELYNDDYVSLLKLGQTVEAVVKDIENERGMLELSFRSIGRDKIWSEVVSAYEEKKTIEAKIRDTNRGGFLIKAMGVYGFLPASLLAPAHTLRTNDGVSNTDNMKKMIGQSCNVKIISIDSENDTIVVSEKAASDEVAALKLSKHSVGETVKAEVTGLVDFGAFVRFDHDLEGLIHISELSWKSVHSVEDVLKVGQKIQAKIIDIDSENRVSLSLKQTQENPWLKFAKNAKNGDPFEGQITKITSFGLVVTSPEEINGICHLNQLDAEGALNAAKIHEYFKIGDVKKFTILSLEKDKMYLTLLPIELAKKRLTEQKIKEEENRKKSELEMIEQEMKKQKAELKKE